MRSLIILTHWYNPLSSLVYDKLCEHVPDCVGKYSGVSLRSYDMCATVYGYLIEYSKTHFTYATLSDTPSAVDARVIDANIVSPDQLSREIEGYVAYVKRQLAAQDGNVCGEEPKVESDPVEYAGFVFKVATNVQYQMLIAALTAEIPDLVWASNYCVVRSFHKSVICPLAIRLCVIIKHGKTFFTLWPAEFSETAEPGYKFIDLDTESLTGLCQHIKSFYEEKLSRYGDSVNWESGYVYVDTDGKLYFRSQDQYVYHITRFTDGNVSGVERVAKNVKATKRIGSLKIENA